MNRPDLTLNHCRRGHAWLWIHDPRDTRSRGYCPHCGARATSLPGWLRKALIFALGMITLGVWVLNAVLILAM